MLTNPFSLVDLEQGTQDWLAWRRGGIGASDAPAIMGENPWKSASTLAREKVHRRGSDFTNAAMAEGNRLEPVARALYVKRHGVSVAPACLQSHAHDWMKASVDGICAETARVVEIKCGKGAYDKTVSSGKPPRYYVGQLQHILAITGYARIDFCCYMPGRDLITLTVPRDEDYIARLLIAEQAFWDVVRQGLDYF